MYEQLLQRLTKLKGKFLLSSYPNAILGKYIKKYKWRVQKISKSIAVTKLTSKQKTELLIYNYDEEHAEGFTQAMEMQQLTSELQHLKV
jgi:DNA adenine methylase